MSEPLTPHQIVSELLNEPKLGEAMQEIARVSFVAGWLMSKNLTMEDKAEQRRAEQAFNLFQHRLWAQEEDMSESY